MDLAEQLRLWGQTHAAARAAEREAGQRHSDAEALQRQARALRERADRLHGEVYGALGRHSRSAGKPTS